MNKLHEAFTTANNHVAWPASKRLHGRGMLFDFTAEADQQIF